MSVSWKIIGYIAGITTILFGCFQLRDDQKDGAYRNRPRKLFFAISFILLPTVVIVTDYLQTKVERAEQEIIKSFSATINVRFRWKAKPFDYRVMNNFPGEVAYLELFSTVQARPERYLFFTSSPVWFLPEQGGQARFVADLEIRSTDSLIGRINIDGLKYISSGVIHMPFFPIRNNKRSPEILDAAVRFKINGKFQIFVNPYVEGRVPKVASVDHSRGIVSFEFPINGEKINWRDAVDFNEKKTREKRR